MRERIDHREVTEMSNKAMLMLAAINDTADNTLHDVAVELRDRVTDIRARAMIEKALSSSEDVMHRMSRFLSGKGVWQEYMDYMDKRQEQITQALIVFRISVKQAADDVREPDSFLLSLCVMASLLLDLAAKSYRQIIMTSRRKARADFSRTLRGMSMLGAQIFFAQALRISGIEGSAAVLDSINGSRRVTDAFKVLGAKIFDENDILAAENYAMNLKTK